MVNEEKFFKVVKQKYPQYDYSKSIFTKLGEPITAICIQHGEFTKKSAFDLYNGRSGCPLCGKEALSQKNKANAKERLEKAKKTNIKKYGVENPYQSEEVKQKIRKTSIEHYGGIGLASKEIAKKVAKTKEDKYGDSTFTNREKCKKTVQERYGVDNVYASSEILEKKKQSYIAHYGVDNPLKVKEVREKGKATMMARYGYDCYGKSLRSRQYLNSEEFKAKRRQTLHEHGTYGKSQAEDRCYKLLQSKYPNAIHHYTSDAYPFECDMYVPELDLYIECNFFWSHGGHFFDETNLDDLKTLEEWKSKHTKFYDIAIHVWAESDLKKLETAHKNNLNYLVCWSEEEFNNYIKNIL